MNIYLTQLSVPLELTISRWASNDRRCLRETWVSAVRHKLTAEINKWIDGWRILETGNLFIALVIAIILFSCRHYIACYFWNNLHHWRYCNLSPLQHKKFIDQMKTFSTNEHHEIVALFSAGTRWTEIPSQQAAVAWGSRRSVDAGAKQRLWFRVALQRCNIPRSVACTMR